MPNRLYTGSAFTGKNNAREAPRKVSLMGIADALTPTPIRRVSDAVWERCFRRYHVCAQTVQSLAMEARIAAYIAEFERQFSCLRTFELRLEEQMVILPSCHHSFFPRCDRQKVGIGTRDVFAAIREHVEKKEGFSVKISHRTCGTGFRCRNGRQFVRLVIIVNIEERNH